MINDRPDFGCHMQNHLIISINSSLPKLNTWKSVTKSAIFFKAPNFIPDSCCTTLRLSTTGIANSSQAVRFGLYERVDTHFDRPVYIHEAIDEYLFYMGGRARGLWMVGPQIGIFSGGLANRGQAQCVEDAKSSSWKFADGSGWTQDPDIKAMCEDDKPGNNEEYLIIGCGTWLKFQ